MFWNPARQHRLGIALLVSLLIAIVVTLFTDHEGSSMVKSGDFPGFYVLAEILARGQAERLYDPALQHAIENELWPTFHGTFYMSVYPPYTAFVLQPLAYLSPGAAQIVWTSVMFVFFISAFTLGILGRSGRWSTAFYLAAVLLFAPVTAAVLGGQNTGFSMFIVASVVLLLRRSERKCDLAAGILLALWLLKPQFGAFALLVLGVCSLRPYLLLSAGCVAFGLYLLGTSVAGVWWPIEWPLIAARFGEQNFISNRAEMISLPGALRAVAYQLGHGPGNLGWSVAAWAGTLVSMFVLVDACRISRRSFQSGDSGRIHQCVVLFAATLPLVSPQTLFYDLGIPIAALVSSWAPDSDKKVNVMLVLVLYALAAFFVRLELHYPVFFPIAVLFYWFSRVQCRTSASR